MLKFAMSMTLLGCAMFSGLVTSLFLHGSMIVSAPFSDTYHIRLAVALIHSFLRRLAHSFVGISPLTADNIPNIMHDEADPVNGAEDVQFLGKNQISVMFE